MSKWIDIDDAIEIVTKIQGMWATTLHALCDAPSREIVTCAECKYKQHCGKAVEHTTYEPTSITIECKPVDFCSYGERDEDE